jgi:hypothetical protein
MKISNLTEALDATEALTEFWARFNAMVAPSSEGGQNTTKRTPKQPESQEPQTPASSLSEMQQVVLGIVKNASGHKIASKDLVDAYQKTQTEPIGDRHNAYTRIYGCAMNMARKGHLVKKGKAFALPPSVTT